jgi:arylsulfatase
MEHENNAFVLDGEWKLVGQDVSPPKGLQKKKWELYHISEDGTELHDLATEKPEMVAALSKQWSEWAARVGVFPKPGSRKR